MEWRNRRSLDHAGRTGHIYLQRASVSWIGGRAPVTGIARVSVDGVFLTEVDTYSKTEEIRVPMFTVNGLANTTHTLAIEVTGRQNAAATSDIIVVDAFDVPGPAVSRLQETDPDISYTAAGHRAIPAGPWSAGITALSTTSGAQATFTFTGTSISWIGARGPQTGIARVSLEASSSPRSIPIPLRNKSRQNSSAKRDCQYPHTLTIQVTGRKNAARRALWW